MNFGVISLFYTAAAVWMIWRLVRSWRGLFDPTPNSEIRQLAGLSAFLLLTPPAVLLHELGHYFAVLAVGAKPLGIDFFLYYGATEYRGPVTPTSDWLIAAAGPLVSLLLGFGGIGVGLGWRIRPAINLLLVQFGVIQLLQILLFYPLLTLAQGGNLPGSDFARLYDLETPELALTALAVHAGSLAAFFFGSRLMAVRRRYAIITAGGMGINSGRTGEQLPLVPGSIYWHLMTHIDSGRPGLLPGGEALPPEVVDSGQTDVQKELDSEPPAPSAGEVLNGLLAVCKTPGRDSRRDLEMLLKRDVRSTQLEPVLRQIPAVVTEPAALYAQTRALALETTSPATVRYALGILSLFRQESDQELLEAFGRHPEFARIAVVALGQMTGNIREAGWRLLGKTTGLARVEVTELLLRNPPDAEINRLILEGLTPGFEGYTALNLARVCQLVDALHASDPDVAETARKILAALVRDAVYGGPDGTIDHFPESAQALRLLLEQSALLPSDETNLTHLAILLVYLNSGVQDSTLRDQERSDLLEQARSTILTDRWRDALDQLLAGPSPKDPLAIAGAATILGYPVYVPVERWMPQVPIEEAAELLDVALQKAGPTELEMLADRVRAMVKIAQDSGAMDKPGIALLLARFVAGLERFPSSGSDVIGLALAHPTVAARMRAIQTLESWPNSALQDEVIEKLRSLAMNDPEASVRNRARALLAAEGF